MKKDLKASITTVELFAGIGGFRIASDSLKMKTVFANDINSESCAVYESQFGSDVLVHGDILDLIHDVPDHDILTGGFPCQPFSFAGKKKGVGDKRADTLDAISKILELKQPKAFVLENVQSILSIASGVHFKYVLKVLGDAGYRIEWRVFNLRQLGLPQNRNRIILIGIRNDLGFTDSYKLGTLMEWKEQGKLHQQLDGDLENVGRFTTWGVYNENGISETVAPNRWDTSLTMSQVLEPAVDKAFFFTEETKKRILESTKIHCIIDGVEVLWNQQGGRRMGYTIFGTSGLAPTLTSTSSRHYERFKVGRQYRRLTPVEYERLQGFPDGHTAIAKSASRYVMLGNAIAPQLAEVGLMAALMNIN
jgi:DNA (cytosine-5)-methyltransferase 1